MKILVVHEVGYLSKLIYEFQILPEALSLLGHQVTIVDYEDSWHSEARRPLFDFRTRVRSNVHRAFAGASVTVRTAGMIRASVVSRITGAIAGGIEISRLLARGEVDRILLYGVPTLGLQTMFAARKYGVPVLHRSIDVSHEIAPYPFRYPTLWIERRLYRGVDRVSALTPRLGDYVASHGVPRERIDVTPAGVDVEAFSPGPPDRDLLGRWGIGPSEIVALFMGTIYRFSGLERVIADIASMSPRPNLRILVVGHGEDEARLKRRVSALGASGFVTFTGLQPYRILPDVIRSSHVCLNPFELNDITRDILPTKLFQYLSCARPLLATRLPGMLPFLAGEEHGVVYAEPDEFAQQLVRLSADPVRCETLGARGAAAVREHYDWMTIARKIEAQLQELRVA